MSDMDRMAERIRKFSNFLERMEEARLRASIDLVSGLPSRALGEAFLVNAMAEGNVQALMLVDLDQFKSVNERWGHAAGDRVLNAVGAVLAEGSERFEMICRWDGDEFALIPKAGMRDLEIEAESLARRLSKLYAVAVGNQVVDIEVNASAGVAKARPGDEPQALLDRAEEALDLSKARVS